MIERINIFKKLGEVLQKGIPSYIAQKAIEQNEWFTAQEIDSAIEAICKMMLDGEKLDEWLAKYPNLPQQKGEEVLIIMAGNIPLVGFFDILCVICAGHTAIVKPSHKDRVLTEWIIALLKEIEPSTPIYIIANEQEARPSRVIATGSDAAALHFKALFGDKKLLLRASRHSIAILSGKESDEELRELGNDIYSYSGQGCRNISMIFIPKGYDTAKLAADEATLAKINQKYRNNFIQNRALLAMSGTPFIDSGASCFVTSSEFPLRLSTISICEYESIDIVQGWIAAHDNEIQCIASNIETIAHPRKVRLGEAQHPTLFDYADGVDTMIFLQ